MSHVSKIEIQVNDLEALQAACERLGGKFLHGKTRYEWFGQFMRDWPLPDGIKEEDLGKCQHAMSFPGARYEVGVVPTKNGKGYTLLFDFWRSGGLDKVLGEKGEKLKQAYGIEKTRRAARRKGYAANETKQADGRMRLTLTRL
jgi:hypothetical protein